MISECGIDVGEATQMAGMYTAFGVDRDTPDEAIVDPFRGAPSSLTGLRSPRDRVDRPGGLSRPVDRMNTYQVPAVRGRREGIRTPFGGLRRPMGGWSPGSTTAAGGPGDGVDIVDGGRWRPEGREWTGWMPAADGPGDGVDRVDAGRRRPPGTG